MSGRSRGGVGLGRVESGEDGIEIIQSAVCLENGETETRRRKRKRAGRERDLGG
jgi:ribosome-associated protein YbcJ (S4-like RNA binding protein)